MPLNCLFLALKTPVESVSYGVMRREQKTLIANTNEPEIEALLDRSQTNSIVDRLMALPPVVETQLSDEWSRAVALRLEAVLAENMRSRIGSESRAA